MGGLSIEKIMIIAVIAVVILGPQRLPYYASQLAKGVKWARGMIQSAQDRMREEMGDEFDEVDWKKLDPRQYDPRRIIREALLEEPEPRETVKPVSSGGPSDASSGPVRPATALSVPPGGAGRRVPSSAHRDALETQPAETSVLPPFDAEAT
jgi:sec-independent protein translocase protein TatB